VGLFEKIAEPNLIQPTFVTEYPIEESPLARRNDQKPEFVDRFELYISGGKSPTPFPSSTTSRPEGRFLEQAKAKARGMKKPGLWTRTTCGPWNTGCRPPPGGDRSRPPGHAVDRFSFDPGRHPLSPDAAGERIKR